MRRLRNKPWTEKDGERLKAFVAEGTSVFRAASIFKTSVAYLRERAHRLGTPFPTLREARNKLSDES